MSMRDLVRPHLQTVAPYDPGFTLEELQTRYQMANLTKLNWNENLFGPLPGVRQAIARETDNLWMYPEQSYVDLRQAIGQWLGIPAGMVIPGHGIQALLLSTMTVFLEPHDVVVTATPTYGLYGQLAKAADARLIRVPVDANLSLDLAAMARVAREQHAKMIIVCDPNNPTGHMLNDAVWQQFLETIPPGVAVIVDEAYIDFSEAKIRDRRLKDVLSGRPVILLRSFSKLFGLAGLRLGFAVVPSELAAAFDAVQEPFNINRMALAAGLACLANPEAVDKRRLEVVAARDRLETRLADEGFSPLQSHANFVLTGLADPSQNQASDSAPDDVVLTEHVIRRGLVLRAGSEFAMPGYVRITVAPVPVMDQLVDAMVDARRVLTAENRWLA